MDFIQNRFKSRITQLFLITQLVIFIPAFPSALSREDSIDLTIIRTTDMNQDQSSPIKILGENQISMMTNGETPSVPHYSIETDDDVEFVPNERTIHSKAKKKSTPKPDPAIDDLSEEDIVPDIANKPKTPKPGHSTPSGGKVIFEEKFSERTWDSRWVYTKSESSGNESKKFEKFFRVRTRRGGTKAMDNGLITSNKGSEDYAISATFPAMSTSDGPLVMQFSIQYQSIPHCENVFLRLFDCRFKPEDFNPDTPYLIQIGPEICASNDVNQLSVVIYDPTKSEKHQVNSNIPAIASTDLHVYSFTIHPDGNYQILANDKSVQNGSVVTTIFPKYQGYSSICAVGLSVWHSVLDKFFKGQIIIDDILVATDVDYAEKQRLEILGSSAKNNSQK